MDGEPIGMAVTLGSGNNWAYTWNNLDVDAEWTVDEPNVPSRYTKNVTTYLAGKYTITNTWDGTVGGGSGSSSSGSGTAQTGDDNPMGLWWLLAFISILGLQAAIYFRKRLHSSE